MVVEEEEEEGGSTRVVCPPWSDAEKKALIRHLGQLEAFPGYPFSHGKNGKKAKSPLVPQHMASWNAICAAVAAECGAALRSSSFCPSIAWRRASCHCRPCRPCPPPSV